MHCIHAGSSVNMLMLFNVSGVGFFLQDTLYYNNRAIPLDDIGGGNGPLMCLTSLRECCRSSNTGGAGALGIWMYPNGSVVPSRSNGSSLYRTRGPSAVLLHRDNNMVSLSGVFVCEVPDSNNMNNVLYTFLYSGGLPGKYVMMGL